MKKLLPILMTFWLLIFPQLAVANEADVEETGSQKSAKSSSGSKIVYIDVYISQPNVEDCLATSSIVPESETTELLKIFPNPNPGIFQIELRLQNTGDQVTISVIDTSGRQVFQIRENPSGEYLVKELDLSFLPKGLYFVNVIEGHNKAVKQLIIQ